MKKNETDLRNSIFTEDNAESIRQVMQSNKNVLICGIKGVGKITSTVQAVEDRINVYYLGNPVDYEGKSRPGSYDKYLKYILTLKKDLKVVDDIEKLIKMKDDIILIIDEIYGRSPGQLKQIGRILDLQNIQVFQIVGCMKNMGALIGKMNIILELHHDGTFVVDLELAKAICRIFGGKETG